MIEQMKKHIYTEVGQCKGIVNGWDVVNEAIVDDRAYWKNKFYQIMDGYFILKILKQDSHETN